MIKIPIRTTADRYIKARKKLLMATAILGTGLLGFCFHMKNEQKYLSF